MSDKRDFYSIFIVILVYLALMGLCSISSLDSFDSSILRLLFRFLFLIYLYVFDFLNKEKLRKFSFRYLPFFILFPFSNFLILLFRKNLSFDFSFYSVFYLIDCLIAAFIEEILFRSLLLKGKENAKARWKYLVLSSCLFSLSHLFNGFNLTALLQVIYTFGLGMVLGSIYLYGGGFFYCVLLHFMFNFFNGYISSCFKGSNNFQAFIICNVIIGTIIVVYYFVLAFIRIKKTSKM